MCGERRWRERNVSLVAFQEKHGGVGGKKVKMDVEQRRVDKRRGQTRAETVGHAENCGGCKRIPASYVEEQHAAAFSRLSENQRERK